MQEELNKFLLESAANNLQFLKQLYFVEGEKGGHLLASIANAHKGTTYISALYDHSGALTSDTNGILTILNDYYADLYFSKLGITLADITQFMDGVTLPILSSVQKAALDSPITLEEL